ncbi:MAG: glycine cleavage system protein GcvH [Candidatus Izemoplasmatales bacterium]|jgi:glycine cleavage system H protein|nr:glycine cleavage system protein GcvH [Acholeplasmataceae bacterium]
MSIIPKGLYYSDDHEWVKVVEGNVVLVGITDFAQQQLGTIVFVDMPEVGAKVVFEDEFGAVESIKAASDLLSPVTGTVIAVNEDLVSEPELINEDAYSAWIVKVAVDDINELDNLLDPMSYEKISR